MSVLKIELPFTLVNPVQGSFKYDAFVAPGVEALYDVDRHKSWPKEPDLEGTSPEPDDSDTLFDLTLNARDANILIADAGVEDIVIGGGGFDFSAFESVTVDGEIQFPSSIMTQLAADDPSERSFMTMLYAKLPTQANWADSTSNPSNISKDFFGLGLTSTSGPADPAVSWHLSQTNDYLRARVDVSGGAINLDVSLAELSAISAFGAVCQIAIWATPSGKFMRIKTASGEQSKSNATATWGASFAARQSIFGASAATGRIGESETEGLRFYRVGFENLKTSGRTPTTVLDADWTRTIARGVFT